MCGDCFVCIYLVCQCDGLELGRRNRRITVRGVAVRINTHVSLAIDPSLWLQITSNFPLCVQMMLSPLPIMTEPLIGVSLYTPVLLLVMWLVAAESPIKMSFPMLESVISLVTRA